ncbi:MAG: hypothetical protein COA43_00480 [Robiginitomaculum sp.]|nr:MAG: hypothetical protein COA43_00480 [Robiginitomaculum sp.]
MLSENIIKVGEIRFGPFLERVLNVDAKANVRKTLSTFAINNNFLKPLTEEDVKQLPLLFPMQCGTMDIDFVNSSGLTDDGIREYTEICSETIHWGYACLHKPVSITKQNDNDKCFFIRWTPRNCRATGANSRLYFDTAQWGF